MASKGESVPSGSGSMGPARPPADGPGTGVAEEEVDDGDREPMTRAEALRLAWIWWVALLLIPFAYFVVIVWLSMTGAWPAPRPGVAMWFFMASLLWLLLAVPGTFLLRNYVFRAYWEDRPVEPRSYLRGMVTIWLAPEIGGLIALTGVLVSGEWVPCLLPAAAAFVLFTPFWPTGGAMYEPVGAEEDDEVFRYPR